MKNNRTAGKTSPFLSEVIVDFIFDDGLFFISIVNLSYHPVFKVKIKFNKTIKGLNDKKVISNLPLFNNIEFLAPRKEIKTFLDSSESYFNNKQPTKITTTISYNNSEGKKVTGVINHDLEIYKKIGYIRRSSINSVKKEK